MNIELHPLIAGQCGECTRKADTFCSLPPPTLAALMALSTSRAYRRGSSIFMEGQGANGVYLLCAGRVKMSTYSEEGKAIILRIAERGEVLGLSSVILGIPHEKTAHASEDCTASFVKKKDFLDFLETHSDAALNALRQLSNNYHKAHTQICSLGLSSSVGDKLAKLLLQWCEHRSGNGVAGNVGPSYIPRNYTHGDIAEMIGTTRETVTRLLNDFRDRGLIQLSKTELCVPSRQQLKGAIGTKHRNGNGHV